MRYNSQAAAPSLEEQVARYFPKAPKTCWGFGLKVLKPYVGTIYRVYDPR